MTVSAVDAVLQVLEANGFRRLPKPLLVGGTTFDFDAAVTGTDRSHDLVIVSGPSANPQRLAQLLSGLNLTLDSVESRRPVSLVLIGPPLKRSVIMNLEDHARVMTISTVEPTEDEVRSAVAVLLPLRLPQARQVSTDPLEELSANLGGDLTDEHRAIIDSARIGPDAVREMLRTYIDSAVAGDASDMGDRS